MERVFTELTEECDYTAQYYAAGFEKKEIAEKKHRSLHTIINQLRTAFEILGVRNGRELAHKAMRETVRYKGQRGYTTDGSFGCGVRLATYPLRGFSSGNEKNKAKVPVHS